MTATTITGLYRPATRGMAGLYDAAVVGLASILIGLAAQVAFPLPFTPVPVTLQTLVVLLAGATLGSRRGALAVALMIAEGAAGLPVFSGWIGGVAHLLGPRGGYLLGFALAAYTTGLLAEHGWDRRPWTAAGAMLIGNACLYLVGLPWLALFVGAARALPLGLYPFMPGDLVKIAVATTILPLVWRGIGR